MSQEILNAKTPEDLIAIGKKLQEQGETLKVEGEGVKQEEEEEQPTVENGAVADNSDEAIEIHSELKQAQAVSAQQDQIRLANLRAGVLDEGLAAPKFVDISDNTQVEIPEKDRARAIELNNRIVSIKNKEAKVAALESLTVEELSLIAKKIAADSKEGQNILPLLTNYANKPELIAQPEILGELKRLLSSGKIHLYNVERIISLPDTEEILTDSAVRKGVQESMRGFFSAVSENDLKYAESAIDAVKEKMAFNNSDLYEIAGLLAPEKEGLGKFIKHFGLAPNLISEI